MKIVASVADLRRAMSAMLRIVATREHIPILRNVKLTARDGSLSIAGTDMVRGLVMTIPARSDSPSETTIEAKRFGAFLDGLFPEAECGLDADAKTAKLRSGYRSATLPVLPTDAFPPISPDEESIATFDLGEEELARIAALTTCALISEAEFYFGGVHLASSMGGLLTAMSGGGSMMAQAKFNISVSRFAKFDGATIPVETAAILPKLFPKGLALKLTERRAVFTDDTTTLVSKLVEGPYPADKIEHALSAIAAVDGLSITVDGRALLDLSARLSAIAEEDRRSIQMVACDGYARLISYAPDGKEAEDRIEAETQMPLDRVLSFTVTSDNIKKILTAIGGETICFRQPGVGEPVRVEVIGDPTRQAMIAAFRGWRNEVQSEREAA